MKNYGTVGQGEVSTRVYVRRIVGKEVLLDTKKHAPVGFIADGFVEVRTGNLFPGTDGAFNSTIVERAREFLIESGIIRKYKTMIGSTEYEIV